MQPCVGGKFHMKSAVISFVFNKINHVLFDELTLVLVIKISHATINLDALNYHLVRCQDEM